jgi:hypothetical protein
MNNTSSFNSIIQLQNHGHKTNSGVPLPPTLPWLSTVPMANIEGVFKCTVLHCKYETNDTSSLSKHVTNMHSNLARHGQSTPSFPHLNNFPGSMPDEMSDANTPKKSTPISNKKPYRCSLLN